MASNAVRVKVDDPNHGWGRPTIKTEQAGDFQYSFSSTPYRSFLDLIPATSLMSQGNGDATVPWNAEPTEYELRFKRSGQEVELEIHKHSDNRRMKGRGEVVLR